ncbi:hypothetical protein K0M31_005615 [Melipona bicolor]|uniref:Uncharacterized protein n=1 Tax=Melipona bicolor TaxID=60889 RepID=A0AA40FTY4_9HYME|nr:hypothetical protein K0M31_005615 [Melipona bicolor]
MRREKLKVSKEDEKRRRKQQRAARRTNKARARRKTREEQDEAEVSGEVMRQGEDGRREDRVGPVTRGERTIM